MDSHRLVATEVCPKHGEPVHASTPPLDAMRAVQAVAAARQADNARRPARGGGFRLAWFDVGLWLGV